MRKTMYNSKRGYASDVCKILQNLKMNSELNTGSRRRLSVSRMNKFHMAVLNLGMVYDQLTKDMDRIQIACDNLHGAVDGIMDEDYADSLAGIADMFNIIKGVRDDFVGAEYNKLMNLYDRDVRGKEL